MIDESWNIYSSAQTLAVGFSVSTEKIQVGEERRAPCKRVRRLAATTPMNPNEQPNSEEGQVQLISVRLSKLWPLV